MSIGVLSMLALLPVLVVALFLVVLKWPASRAMPLAYLSVVVLGLWVWKLPVAQIGAATVRGLVTTLELLYIIFGAILMLNTLQESGAFESRSARLHRHYARQENSSDYRRLALQVRLLKEQRDSAHRHR